MMHTMTEPVRMNQVTLAYALKTLVQQQKHILFPPLFKRLAHLGCFRMLVVFPVSYKKFPRTTLLHAFVYSPALCLEDCKLYAISFTSLDQAGMFRLNNQRVLHVFVTTPWIYLYFDISQYFNRQLPLKYKQNGSCHLFPWELHLFYIWHAGTSYSTFQSSFQIGLPGMSYQSSAFFWMSLISHQQS